MIDTVIEAGADGIMTTLGVMKKYRNVIAGRVPVRISALLHQSVPPP